MLKNRKLFLMALVSAGAVLTLFLTACTSLKAENNKAAATIVLRGGVIQTMDADRTTASAVAIVQDSIVYVGDDAGVENYIGDETEIIELKGRLVLPGFIDSHIHSASGWITALFQCELFALDPTETAYVKAIQTFAEKNPELPVIIGSGFQVNAFGENGPSKEALDSVVSDRPVIITDTSQHSYWVNSAALKVAGVSKETPTPKGGKIYYNQDGSLRGYFADCMIFDDVFKLGATTIEQYEQAWIKWQEEANSFGITAFSGGGVLKTEASQTEIWSMVDRLKNEDRLTLRANIPYLQESDELTLDDMNAMIRTMDEAQQYVSDFQVVKTVKLFIDGVVEGRTGMLLEPYDTAAGTDPDYRGEPIWSPEKLQSIIEITDANGYAMHMHAIADGSARLAVDSIEKAVKSNGTEDPRHTLAHLTLLDPAEMPRMAEYNIIAAMQPTWFYRDPWFSKLEEQMLGTERFTRMYAIRDMLEAGVIMTGSADYNVLPDYRPLTGIEAGVTQCSPYPGQDNDPTYIRNADQAVSLMQMLEAYTINGAFQMGMEDRIGSIETGKLADLVILEENLFQLEPKDIAETEIAKTILGGKIVYSK